MPRISTKVYVIGQIAFIAHPAAAGLWLRTDISVVKTGCEHCEAKIYEPCRSKHQVTASTHYVRRNAARHLPMPKPITRTLVVEDEVA